MKSDLMKENKEILALIKFAINQNQINEMFEKNISELDNRLAVQENEAEITRNQAKELNNQVKKKVRALLNDKEYPIYAKKVFSEVWRYLKNNGCAEAYSATPKKDYQKVLNALHEYNPDISTIKTLFDRDYQLKISYHQKNEEKVRGA